MLSNRRFEVYVGEKMSSTRRLNSGELTQGGVLSPLLFILYISDLPATGSKKFIFADDLTLALQYGYDNTSERWAIRNMNNDLAKLAKFYETNRLRANPSKTEVTTFVFRTKMHEN